MQGEANAAATSHGLVWTVEVHLVGENLVAAPGTYRIAIDP